MSKVDDITSVNSCVQRRLTPVCQRGVKPVWLLSASGRDRNFVL